MKSTSSARIKILYSHVDLGDSPNQGKIVLCEVKSRWDVRDPKVTKSGYYEIKATDGTVRLAYDVWVQ